AAPSPKIATAFTYDNLGHLSRLTRAAGDASSEWATDYTWEGMGRLRKETQYPSWPATAPTLATQFTYDGSGNQMSLLDPLGQTTTFAYDALNRLTAISYSDGQTANVAYTYDANGDRTGITDGTGSTTYSYDELGRVLGV